jgi:hypothetical protein
MFGKIKKSQHDVARFKSFSLQVKIMSVYEEKKALPFFAYRDFVGRLKSTEPGLYSYLNGKGLVLGDEGEYRRRIGATVQNDCSSRQEWEEIAKTFRDSHMGNIDLTASEIRLLSRSVKPKGTIVYVGYGNGDISESLEADVVGVDYSKGMLMQSNRQGVLAECGSLPIKPGTADKIIFSGVQCNADTMKQMDYLLKSDGEMVFELTQPFIIRTPPVDSYDKYFRMMMTEKGIKSVSNSVLGSIDCGAIEMNSSFQKMSIDLERNGFTDSVRLPDTFMIPRPTRELFTTFPEYSQGVISMPYILSGKKSK